MRGGAFHSLRRRAQRTLQSEGDLGSQPSKSNDEGAKVSSLCKLVDKDHY